MSEENNNKKTTYVKMNDTRTDFYCLLSNMWEFVSDLKIAEDETAPDGWYLFERTGTKREAGDGEVRAFHFTVADGVVKREYLVISEEEAKKGKWHKPRTFSKLKLYAAVKSLGLWADVKAWLEASDLWDAFVLAQDVAEDNEQFAAGIKTFKEKFALSDERVEEILASCVAEETAL